VALSWPPALSWSTLIPREKKHENELYSERSRGHRRSSQALARAMAPMASPEDNRAALMARYVGGENSWRGFMRMYRPPIRQPGEVGSNTPRVLEPSDDLQILSRGARESLGCPCTASRLYGVHGADAPRGHCVMRAWKQLWAVHGGFQVASTYCK
jgi:hypothetical protein